MSNKFLAVAVAVVVAVLFTACKESVPTQEILPAPERKSIGIDDVFPAEGLYGENILSDAVTVIKRGQSYSMYAYLPEFDYEFENSLYQIDRVVINTISTKESDIYFGYNEETKLLVNWVKGWGKYKDTEYHQEFSTHGAGTCDMLVQVLTEQDYITIKYSIVGFASNDMNVVSIETIPKTKMLRVVN